MKVYKVYTPKAHVSLVGESEENDVIAGNRDREKQREKERGEKSNVSNARFWRSMEEMKTMATLCRDRERERMLC